MMRLPTLLALSASLWAQTPAAVTPDEWDAVLFPARSSGLTSGLPGLLRLAELLRDNDGYRVRLEGRTDGLEVRGAPAAALARARAEAVREFLLKHGAAENQVEAVAVSSAAPGALGGTAAARFAARSVAISLRDAQGRAVSARQKEAPAPPPATPAPAGVYEALKSLDKLDDIIKRLDKLDDVLVAQKDLEERLDAMGRAMRPERAAATKAMPPDNAEIRHVGRALLLPGGKEPENYGLYSYILLPSPPANDKERARYTQVIEAYLRLGDIGAIEAALKTEGQLNTRQLHRSVVPVTGVPKELKAEALLGVYDYVRADLLIEKAAVRQSRRMRGGPYLVCVLAPLTRGTPHERLVEILDWAPPGELVNAWFQFFLDKAATPRDWDKKNLREVALNAQTWLENMAPKLLDTGHAVATSLLWFSGKSGDTPKK